MKKMTMLFAPAAIDGAIHRGVIMKRNTPVTQNEYLLNEDSTLLSTTDTQSHITYANTAFVEASGFTEEQLKGQPHNIIRHPDMPPAAFGDMWFTLQQGDSWTGIVKNRRNNAITTGCAPTSRRSTSKGN